MPTKGQVITNPKTGDSYEYIETARDTNGARVTMKAAITAKGKLVPNHLHLLQDETFEILSGQLTVWSNGQETKLSAGEKLTLQKNNAHNHYNTNDIPVVYLHTVVPALDFDYFIENAIGLAADRMNKSGKSVLIQQMVTLKYLDSKAYLADVPIGVQRILMNTLAPIGRLLGYRAIYKKYSDIEK
jgi:quercetin dioxygenase-like cupin family protein